MRGALGEQLEGGDAVALALEGEGEDVRGLEADDLLVRRDAFVRAIALGIGNIVGGEAVVIEMEL